jgi:cation:H+ antiporter
MAVFLFILGLVFMIVGAEFLVRGASTLAMMVGVSPLVVGLTVVAFGTSAPELAVSFKAALADQANICVGNVVGSNIFNVLFILGLSSILVPLIVAPQLIRLDLPLVIGASILTLMLGWDGSFSRVDGSLFLVGLLIYTVRSIYASRQSSLAPNGTDAAHEQAESSPANKPMAMSLAINIGLIIGGLTLLIIGANWLVDTAVTFARWLQVSELVIGLTIVSIGTSLPEVVTSLVASLKGERDIAVGNVVGSNLFNILGVLGLSAIVAPSGIAVSDQLLQFDIPVMIAVAVIALPIFMTGKIISRVEGVIFLGYYVAYTIYLIMDATDDARLSTYGQVIAYGAVPITLLVLILGYVKSKSAANGSDPQNASTN